MSSHHDPVYLEVQIEKRQLHATRKRLYQELEKVLDMPVLAFFTSFRHPVMIDDWDADTCNSWRTMTAVKSKNSGQRWRCQRTSRFAL
jgi:hypothetical protein